MLGNDWVTKYNVQYNSTRSHLSIVYLRKVLYIPTVQRTKCQPEYDQDEFDEKENNTEYDQNEFDEEDSIIGEEDNTDSEFLSTCSVETNSTSEPEELLIDLTTPDEEMESETGPPIFQDIFKIDAQMFQQEFNQAPLIAPDVYLDSITEKDSNFMDQTEKGIVKINLLQQILPKVKKKDCKLLTNKNVKKSVRVNNFLQEHAFLTKNDPLTILFYF